MNFKRDFNRNNEFYLLLDTNSQKNFRRAFGKDPEDAHSGKKKAQKYVENVFICFASKLDITFDQAVLAWSKGKIPSMRAMIQRHLDPLNVQIEAAMKVRKNIAPSILERVQKYETLLSGNDVDFVSKVSKIWDFAAGVSLERRNKSGVDIFGSRSEDNPSSSVNGFTPIQEETIKAIIMQRRIDALKHWMRKASTQEGVYL